MLATNVHLRLLPSHRDKTNGTLRWSSLSLSRYLIVSSVSPRNMNVPCTKMGAREAFLKLLAVHESLVGCPIVCVPVAHMNARLFLISFSLRISPSRLGDNMCVRLKSCCSMRLSVGSAVGFTYLMTLCSPLPREKQLPVTI